VRFVSDFFFFHFVPGENRYRATLFFFLSLEMRRDFPNRNRRVLPLFPAVKEKTALLPLSDPFPLFFFSGWPATEDSTQMMFSSLAEILVFSNFSFFPTSILGIIAVPFFSFSGNREELSSFLLLCFPKSVEQFFFFPSALDCDKVVSTSSSFSFLWAGNELFPFFFPPRQLGRFSMRNLLLSQ